MYLIDENIIRNFTSNYDRQASFSVVITGIKQEAKCNKDILTLETQYVDPNVFTIIRNQQDILDDIKKAKNFSEVTSLLQRYNTLATEVSQVIGRNLIIQSELVFDEGKKLYSSKINGYQDSIESTNILKTDVSGKIVNGVSKITSPDFPSRITFNDIRIVREKEGNKTVDRIKIKFPNNVKNIKLMIDNREYSGSITNNQFIATVNGVMEGEHTFGIYYDIDKDIVTKNIEMAVTPLDKQIEVTFNKKYHEIPCVYVTIDEKHQNLYSAYTTAFKGKYVCPNCGHEHIGYNTPKTCPSCGANVFQLKQYYGVKLTFKNLKRRASYPNINITIIGGEYNE